MRCAFLLWVVQPSHGCSGSQRSEGDSALGKEPGWALSRGAAIDLSEPPDPRACLGPGLPIHTVGKLGGAVLGPCHLWDMCHGLLCASHAQTAAQPGAVVRPSASWAFKGKSRPLHIAILLYLGK